MLFNVQSFIPLYDVASGNGDNVGDQGDCSWAVSMSAYVQRILGGT